MLVLRRNIGETIVTSNGVTFKILRIYRGQVSVGVSADPSVRIDRGEIAELKAHGATPEKGSHKH